MKKDGLLLKIVTLCLGFCFPLTVIPSGVVISTTVSPELEVCGGSETFEILITNNSVSTLQNPTVKIELPTGIEYVNGSINELTSRNLQEQNVLQDTALYFSSDNLTSGDSIKFSISIIAKTESVTYQNLGNLFRNNTTLTHDAGSETDESDSYNILYPALTILSVSPNSGSILSGNSTTRDISIINGGNGKTSTLYITDIRNSGILNVTGVNIGTINGDTITLSGSDFTSIGNGDIYFDQNESITITETLSGTSCSDITVTSNIKAHWGCNGDLISTSSSYANLTIDFQNPNLKLLATQTLESCFGSGVASEQTLRVINKGTGIASDVEVSIFKSTGGNYNQNIFSRFDASSLQFKIGENGSYSTVSGVTTTATNNSGDYSCLGSNPVGKMEFTLSNMQPEDTIFLKWDMYSCCVQTCENDAVKGWRSTVNYSDICSSGSYSTNLTGQNKNNHYISFTTETPTDIINGEEENYTFIVSSFKNDLPAGSGSNYEVVFTLEDGLVYKNMKFHSNGTEWTPTSVNYNASSNVVTAIFPSSAPFTVAKSEIELTLEGNCGSAGWKTIELDMSYIPDNTCSGVCSIPIECDHQVTTYLHCPLPSCNGLNVLDFSVVRTNFGEPDNNLDGLADASGSLDMTEVKDNRAMTGDTIQASVSAIVETSSDTWEYAKFTSTVDYGAVLEFIEVDLTIYDASSSSYYTVSGLTPSTTSNVYEESFIYDLSIGSLAALNSSLSGYSYANGDSIKMDAKYKVFNSVIGLLQETTFLNEFYLSDVANPNSSQKDNCNFKNGRITLIGYSFRNNSPSNATVTSCSKFVNQNFGMSIGDLSSNYGGGNLFPYEHREWGSLKEVWMIIPANYSFVSANIRQWRTRRTNSTSSNYLSSIVPDNIVGDTLYFDVEQYYTSGQIVQSDDGFHGRIQVELSPNCDVPENTYQDIIWLYNYQKTEAIDGNESGTISASTNDKIRFKRSSLTLTSDNPWQDANTRNVIWDYKIKNNSSSSATNAWIHLTPPPNFTVDSIVNDQSNTTLSIQNDIYLVGNIGANSTANLSVYGTFSNCDTVLMYTYVGYECTGYPSEFSTFTCPYETMPLYVEPKPSGYQTRISTELLEDPCSSELDLIVDITSVKIAHMYDMSIDFITQDTNKIAVKNSTSEFQYNTSNSYSSIADPALSIDTFNYNINDFVPSFESNGIPGVLDLSNNRYRLKSRLELGSQFQNGDFLQVQINGSNACDVSLPTINLAFDPSIKFSADNTSGLHLDAINSWSASWGDYDNDGYDDLFVPSKDINTSSFLYKNNTDGTFTQVTTGSIATELGASVSGTWGDYDNDGDIDLFVTNNENSPNKLFQNNGNGTFTKITGTPVTDNGIYSHSASWADYNKDGNLDLVVSDFHSTHFNKLFYGDGNGGFTLDQASVISQTAGSSVGVAWGDYDNDGDVDLFIANTNGENNKLFQNNSGSFIEITTGAVVNDGGFSVGAIWGDYDNDGDLDLYVTNSTDTEANFLYENNGDGTFTKITNGEIVTDKSNSHGASWIDYDNDGDLDLTVANDQGENNFMYSNDGDKTFTKMTNAIVESENNSYGISWSDFDNDGDYDLYVSNQGNTNNDFYKNDKGSCTNHIVIKLIGCNSNRDGIGAKIRIKANIDGTDVWQTKHISTQTSGMAGQNSNKILFGLKDAGSVDSLIIEWPSGTINYITNPPINTINTINEECGSRICGVVFNDKNSNGTQDSGESGIPNYSLVISPGGHQVYTNEFGEYQLYLNDGSYDISLNSNSDWDQTYPELDASHNLVIDKAISTEYCDRDFGIRSICTSPDLSVNVGTTAFRRGLTNMLNVIVSNIGAYDATNNIDVLLTLSDNVYILDQDWSYSGSSIGYNSYTKTFTNLEALSDTVFELTDSVDVNASLEDIVSVECVITYNDSECDTTDNDFATTDIVVGSIDPNDKAVYVQNVGVSRTALDSDVLIYKIRFQNLGTYSARIVHIVDKLSTNLDWNTFQIESSSHPFEVSMVDGEIHWINNNIELPDSLTDPEGSQGFVTFSISPKKGLPIYTLIENSANIRFDFNEYITTNTVETYINPSENDKEIPMVKVYPNPGENQIKIMLVNTDQQLIHMDNIEIYNISGGVITNEPANSMKKDIDISNLKNGMYKIKITNGADSYYGKLVKL